LDPSLVSAKKEQYRWFSQLAGAVACPISAGAELGCLSMPGSATKGLENDQAGIDAGSLMPESTTKKRDSVLRLRQT